MIYRHPVIDIRAAIEYISAQGDKIEEYQPIEDKYEKELLIDCVRYLAAENEELLSS